MPAIASQLRVVLVATRNPLNIGAAARAMSNFGVGHLRLVTPFAPAREAAQSAVGAAAVLREAEEYQSIAAAVADCSLVVGTGTISRRRPVMPVWSLPQAVPLLHQHVEGEGRRVALLFGSEKCGLANEDLSHCDWLLHIPTSEEREGNDSMNLGQAVAVCLYAITCGGIGEGAAPAVPVESERPRASAGENERLLELLHECLLASGYLSPAQKQSAEQTHRRLLQEAGLSPKHVELAMGMLRTMLRTMRLR